MKGFLFTSDALFALLIVSSAVPLIIFLAATGTNTSGQTTTLQADSAIEALSGLKVRNVIREPVIFDLYAQGVIDNNDLNQSVMNLISKLWATNTTENLTRAQNITQQLLDEMLPENVEFSLSLENETLYNTGGSLRISSATGRRIASGYLKGSNSSGYVANMFLTSIGGKKAYSYYFFGGFVGQGNITAFIKDIPEDAAITELYLEVSTGSNFTLLINGNFCGTFNKTTDPVNATINGSCLGYISPGQDNQFVFTFMENNITYQYFGGGFLRVTYTTNELLPSEENRTVLDLPGIDGIINYFGSFYANGNITSMELRMHFWNNYSTYVNIGNVTVFNTSGNASDQNFTISNGILAAKLNYTNLSSRTVPLRIGVGIPNVTAGDGIADVILITDNSGSMEWNFTCTSTSSCSDGVQIDNCTNSSLFSSSTKRISVAKCLDKNFIAIILNNTGNRIGLVGFSGDADNYINLTDNMTRLTTEINSYTASGSTCVACAINRAYSMLQSQSNPNRKKFIVTMTDGVANIRPINTCNNLLGAGPYTGYAFAGGSGGELFTRNYTGNWNNFRSPNTNQINDIDMLNSTFGFSVGSSGTILKWNGTLWSNMTSPVSSSIYSVDIYNATFAIAVGSSGRVLRWNGTVWSNPATISNSPTLYSVSILLPNLTFASGIRDFTGRIYKSVNNGSTWTEDYAGESNYRGVRIFNSTRAYAVGTNGDMLRWNKTAWTYISAPVGDDLYGLEYFNSTYALAVGGDDGQSVILKYNGTGWTSIYDVAGDSLHDIVIYQNYSYAIGEGATMVELNGTWNRTYRIPRAYTGNSTSGTLCTSDLDTCSEYESFPGLNANYSSCRAHKDLNSTIHSVGFGPVSSCAFAGSILGAIAKCGNGTYYSSSNTSELELIYRSMAEDIVTQTYTNQTTIISDNVTSRIYPDSYLAINFTQDASVAYQEIATYVETDRFSNCNHTFFVPPQFRVDDIKVTSFSGALWTTNTSVNSSLTSGFDNAYLLSKFGTNFQVLGDPFVVSISPNKIKSGENNTVSIYLGVSATNISIACPSNSTVIYRARFRASIPYGAVFSEARGGIARVYYDINHDGTSDGFIDVSYGSNLTNFDPTIKTMDQLNATGNALDDAFIRLMDELNFVINAGNSGIAGSEFNPIDIKLADVYIDTTSVGGIPFAWGPIDIRLDVKI